MDLRELKEFNKNAMRNVGDIVSQYPDMAQIIHMYFQQADLPMPASPGEYWSCSTEKHHMKYNLYAESIIV